MKITAVLIVLLCAGCARFGTFQQEARYNEKTGEKVTITTKAAGFTFFSAKSSLATWSATQTEKSQGAKVGGLEQNGGVDSNIVNAAVSAAVGAAVRAVKP